MAWFRCQIEGENFPGSLIQKDGLVGFFTTRFVEAPSAELAELKALEGLRHEPALRLGDASGSKDAKVYFIEISEAERPDGPDMGLVWFPMETEPQDRS